MKKRYIPLILLVIPLKLLLPIGAFNWVISHLPKKLMTSFANEYTTWAQNKAGPEKYWTALEAGLDEAGYNKNKGRKFSNSEEELEDALEQVPTLAPFKPYLLRWIQRHRQEVGLPV